MSKIKLNAASGGGSVSLEAPTSTTGNANVEFKLPVADGSSGQALTTNASGQLAFASVAGGKIGQVLQTVKTDTFSRNGASWGDISGFGQDITPSATTSKVLVMVDIKIGTDHGDSDYNFKIVRAGTDIYIGDADGNKRRSSMGTGSYGMPSNTADGQYRLEQVTLIFLDSPSTTSQVTYLQQYRTEHHHVYYNQKKYANRPAKASFVLMEIVA